MPFGNLSEEDCTAVFKQGNTTIYLAPQPNAKASEPGDDCVIMDILSSAPQWPDHGGNLPEKEYIASAIKLADAVDTTKAHILICCYSGIFRSAIVAIYVLIRRFGVDKETAIKKVLEAQGKSDSKNHVSRIKDYFK